MWWSAYRTPGDGAGERCHLNASAAYCLRNAYGCRYCDPFLEAADIRPALGDGDEMDALTDILATLNRYADSDGDPRHRRSSDGKAQAVKIVAPHFCVSEDGKEMSLEWWNGDKSLCCWFDASGENMYDGTDKDAEGAMVHHDFATLHAAYCWLVSEKAETP